MDRSDRHSSNAANALLELECPWCAEPARATEAEFADGRPCTTCLVMIELDPGRAVGSSATLVPVAA